MQVLRYVWLRFGYFWCYAKFGLSLINVLHGPSRLMSATVGSDESSFLLDPVKSDESRLSLDPAQVTQGVALLTECIRDFVSLLFLFHVTLMFPHMGVAQVFAR
jgi:hypothetical protein